MQYVFSLRLCKYVRSSELRGRYKRNFAYFCGLFSRGSGFDLTSPESPTVVLGLLRVRPILGAKPKPGCRQGHLYARLVLRGCACLLDFEVSDEGMIACGRVCSAACNLLREYFYAYSHANPLSRVRKTGDQRKGSGKMENVSYVGGNQPPIFVFVSQSVIFPGLSEW